MSKYTPGPWKTDDEFIYDDSGRSIAYVETYHSGKLPYQANARLIAAAPELLEFVRYVAKGIPVWDDPCSLEESVDHLEERAKRLVAKIEGHE